MSAVQGKNLTIYTGYGMNVIGCEESCTLTITSQEIITTTKGSGRATNREYGSYDWSVNARGVMFMYSSESNADTANRTDPTFFASHILQGKKACVKIESSEGSITKYWIGNGIITQCVYTGSGEGFATFDVTINADGKLYESANATSLAAYDGPSVYVYEATSSVTSFTASELINADNIYFIVRNGVVYPSVNTLPDGTSFPLTGVGVYLPIGYVAFSSALTSGDIILVSYDPA
jgi:hypothetical protein